MVGDPPSANVRAVDDEDVFAQDDGGVVVQAEEEGEGVEPDAREEQLQGGDGHEDKGEAQLELFVRVFVLYAAPGREGEDGFPQEEVEEARVHGR